MSDMPKNTKENTKKENIKQVPDVHTSKQKKNGGFKDYWRHLCSCFDRQKPSAPPENRDSSTHSQDHQAKFNRKLESGEEAELIKQARKALTALNEATTYESFKNEQIYNPVHEYFIALQEYIKESSTNLNKEDLRLLIGHGNRVTSELAKYTQDIRKERSNDIASDVLPRNQTSGRTKKKPGIVIKERSQADQLALDEARVAFEEQRSSLRRSLTLFKDLLENPDALQRALGASEMDQNTFRVTLQQHEQDVAWSPQENSSLQELNDTTKALRSHEEWVSRIHDQAVGKGKGKT